MRCVAAMHVPLHPCERSLAPAAQAPGHDGPMRNLAAALVVCIGCGGGDGGPVPLSDLAARISQAFCQHEVKCGVYADLANCVAEFERLLDERDIEAGVADG